MNKTLQDGEIVDDLRDAKKYMNLMEAFDLKAGNMEENMKFQKNEILLELNKAKDIKDSLISSEISDLKNIEESIIDSDELIADFSLIRKNLRTNIKSTSLLLEKFGCDLGSSNLEDLNADMVSAYSELIKSSNTSMKLLIDSYSIVSKTQIEIKRLVRTNKELDDNNSDEPNINSTNIINFIGTSSEMMKRVRENI